jgi:glutathione S-transferase
MARRKAERPAERGARRAETNAVAAYLNALRAPKVPARSGTNLERRRAQIEEWLSEGSSPIREVELIQAASRRRRPARPDRPGGAAGRARGGVREGGRLVGERSGISAAALREVGVPASVLRRAGLV